MKVASYNAAASFWAPERIRTRFMLGGSGVKKNKGMLIVFMTPAVVMFVLVFLYPIIRTILMSFFKIEGITDPMSKWTFSGIDNYVKLANTTLFRISMWNLARIWFIGGIIVMSLALLFAVIITSGIRFKSFFRAMIYLPNIVSAVALATMWLQYVYSPKYGLIKNFFQALGWIPWQRYSGWIMTTSSWLCSWLLFRHGGLSHADICQRH